MYDSKLLKIVRLFSAKTLRELDKFIHSPFFNTNQQKSDFWDYLYALYPFSNTTKLKAEVVFKHFFPNEKTFDKQKIVRLNNELFNLVQKFIAYQKFDNNKLNQEIALLDFYIQHQHSLIEGQAKDIEEYIDKMEVKDLDFYNARFKLGFTILEHNDLIKNRKPNSINTLQEDMEVIYLVHKIRFWCEQWSRKTILGLDVALPSVENLVKDVEKNQYIDQNNLLKLWYYCLLLIQNPVIFYPILKAFVEENSAFFDKKNLRQIYTLLFYYCKEVTKAEDYFQEAFNLVYVPLTLEVWHENGKIQAQVFTNLVALAIRLKKFDWLDTFFETHKNKILTDTNGAIYKINKARVYFEEGKFKEVIALFHRNDEIELAEVDIFVKLNIRRLILKSYYETNQDIRAYIGTYRTFLSNRKKEIPEERQNIEKQFILFTKKLFELKEAIKPALRGSVKLELKRKLEKIQEELAQHSVKTIGEYNWLLSKKNALKKYLP